MTADVETVSLMEEARQGEVETVSPMGGARQTDVDGVASACGDTWRRKKILSVLGGHFRFNFFFFSLYLIDSTFENIYNVRIKYFN